MESSLKKGPIIGVRHLQALMLFLALAVNIGVRTNVSISLVAMTDSASTNPDFPEFDWDEKQKSYILSSFYWGYVAATFPAAYITRKLGVKHCMLISVFGSSFCNVIIPYCVPWGQWQSYCVLRVLQGLFQGFLFPCVHAHLAIWSPVEERTRLGGLSYLGIEVGTVLAMSFTGLIAASSLGWPGISYIYGGVGIGFCAIWAILAENNPATSRFVTFKEKEYILSSSSAKETRVQAPIPWGAILTSVPFISLIAVRFSQAWGYNIMLQQIPAYLHGVLHMDIKNNSLFSSLPYLAMLICSFVFLLVVEVVLKKQWASLEVIRKTVNTIALWIPGALLIAIGLLDEGQKALALIFLTLNVGLNGGNTIGSLLNTLDLAPNHAGILMGIVNAISNTVPIIAPLVVGIIVYDETQRALWQTIFSIAAVFFFLGNLQYIFLGSTQTQIWNDEHYIQRKTKNIEVIVKSKKKTVYF